MKKLLFLMLYCSLIIVLFTTAQTPEWLWAKRAGGIGDDYNWSCTTDANGNIITNGRFFSPTITLGTTTLINKDTSGNTPDIFVVKYDPNGNVLWTKSAGGNKSDEGWGCAADANGNIITNGRYYSPTIILGTITLTNNDSSGNTSDIYITKYDSYGNILWAKSEGGNNSEESIGSITDASGNIFVTGFFKSSTIILGSNTFTNAGSEDIFIVKYDSNGNCLWGQSAGGAYQDLGISVATDNDGNVIVTGGFGSSSISFGSTFLTNKGMNSPDVFIVKYDPNGNVLWAKSAGGTDSDASYGCTTDFSGNIIITGFFESSSITFGTSTLINTGNMDIFIAKYDPNGNVLWALKSGGTSGDFGINCTTNSNGNIITTGVFESASITFGTTTLTNTGFGDIFIASYDPLGNFLWAKSADGTANDFGVSCTIDNSENIIVTGYFKSPSLTIGTTTLINADTAGKTHDIFILKLNSNLVGISESKFLNEIILFPNPCESKFQLVIGDHRKAIIEIYNLIGKKIFQSIINNQQSTINIDLTNETSGIYFLSLKKDDGLIFKKVVVTR